jgi:Tol biopolymer transport system component
MPIGIGTLLGSHEILSAIGKGGMGEVWRARDRKLGREVAIKTLPAGLATDEDRLARFEREARLLASLNHPNIGSIYGLEESGGERFLVLELVEGETLAQTLKRGPLPAEEAVKLGLQIAGAVEAAHEKGIIHRDLKPGNIMLTAGNGQVKVLDFGLAKLDTGGPGGGSDASLSQSPTLSALPTRAGVLLGTAAYMSPEQVKGQVADKRSDVWAFGCVLYEMLTGARAFEGEDLSDTLAAVLRAEPDGTRYPAGVPVTLRTIVAGCLRKDRNTRIPDIAVVRYLLGEAANAAPPGPIIDRPPRTAWVPWMAAALAFAALLVAGVLVIVPHWREPAPKATQFVVLPPEETTALGAVAVSPDGRSVVFVATAGGANRLFLRPIESAAMRVLPGTEGASYPFWSPDSQFIAFFADGKLKKLSAIAGDPPQTICDAAAGAGGTWGASDVIVFAPTGGSALHRVPAAGGKSTPVTTLDAARKEASHRFPSFLPDGRHFIFGAGTSIYPEYDADRSFDVYIASIDSSNPLPLIKGVSNVLYAEPGYVLFLRDKALMVQRFNPKNFGTAGEAFPVTEDIEPNVDGYGAFSVSATGTIVYRHGVSRADLVWFDRRGTRMNTVKAPLGSDQFDLSPNEQWLAVRARSPQGSLKDIWLVDLMRNTYSRFTDTPADHGFPTWSPDGTRLAYVSSNADQTETSIYEKDVSGNRGASQLLTLQNPFGRPVYLYSWSRDKDSRFLVYQVVAEKTAADLWALPLDGDRKPFPVVQLKDAQYHGSLSSDGRWLAYTSLESGREEVWVQDFPKFTHRVLVSTEDGRQPQWKGDSRELYYLTQSGKLMAVPIRAGPQFEAGVPQELFQIRTPRTPVARRYFQPTRDGQRFLVHTRADDNAVQPFIVTMNWTAELKK